MQKRSDIIITIIFFSLLTFITVGFALYGQNLDISSNLSIKKVGKVIITSVTKDNNSPNTLPANSGTLSLNDNGKLTLDYNFHLEEPGEYNYKETYLITINNESPYEYTFVGVDLQPEVNIPIESAENTQATVNYTYATDNHNNELNLGDSIFPSETKVIAITLNFYVSLQDPSDINIIGSGDVNSSKDDKGMFKASLLNNSVDLSNGNIIDCFQVEALNTYSYKKGFTLTSSNKNFELVKSDGSALSEFLIDSPNPNDPNSNQKTYDVCIKVAPDSTFFSTSSNTSIVLNTTGISNSSIGELNIKVDKSEAPDTAVPEIGNVSFTTLKYDTNKKELLSKVTWNRLDTGGTDIVNYTIELYNGKNDNKIKTFNTNNSIEHYDLILDDAFLQKNNKGIVVNNNDYYVKVYGTDMAGNTGSSYCNNNSNNFCVKSNKTKLKYVFNVNTSNLSGMSLADTKLKVYLNVPYSTTISVDTPNYTLPTEITITMGGINLNSNQFSYYQNGSSTTEATININENVINNDISISGTANNDGGTCLVEGTKIKLYNGKYKNVEDIKYSDLLSAFSYDLGKIVYEYPIWIEKKGTADSYQISTFSDGTILKTVGSHGIFSKDINSYVSILDRKNFHPGTNVVMFDKNNKMKTVKLISVETINEKINYYHVASTRYHNIIANDLLTTDAMLVISNMFPFNDNLTWSSEREEFLKQNDLFYYKDWLKYFPRHVFQGFRMEEAKYLYNKVLLDIELFSQILGVLMKEPIKDIDGKNMWMITTSDDLEKNRQGSLYKEETIYTLPQPINDKNFKGWYNTADNKVYKPNDKVIVEYGMYFEKIDN